MVVWPGNGLMVVGVLDGFETAVVTSGLVFTPLGDTWIPGIVAPVSDGRGPFSVAPVRMPGLLGVG